MADDSAVDQVQLRDNMRMELLILSGELRELRPNIDLTADINPLVADTGGAPAHIIRMQNQIERLRDLLGKSKREASGTWSPAQI
jgi:hypothetical protein